MKLSNFKFNLPEELIAQRPKQHRDEARMMVLHRKDGNIEHKIFKDIINYYDEGDLFVMNNTKVFPARLYGNKEKTGAQIEVFLLRELNSEIRLWDVLVEPARKIRIGNKLYFGENETLMAEVIDNTTSRGRTVRFLYDGTYEEFKKILYSLGEMPLPRSIKRPIEKEDKERFQTIFATEEGAVAVPSAGLHFSRELLKRMEIKGLERTFITSHMNLGNFREIDVEDLTKHKMDSEQIIVSNEAMQTVNRAKDNGKRVCAVGFTVMRALESVAGTEGKIKTYDGWTNKFIFPNHDFSVANSMVTNFQMPYSIFLMLAAAFGGYNNVMNAYKVAVEKKYSFGVYGDALLII
ncbi:MAG: tRNA preQ1(34) S-adenosylmethionine ribosyltransferase-isomerase QueA [Prevotellaceae bacterium]|jgi:S-adenosylmethionine:tRNA ribosyltransferase-isomerase|nr:tRNA preQ1(34) S-adenosylmethionine ribosyltransferase-isomerase QueA [Prevotellaceae bacterium]